MYNIGHSSAKFAAKFAAKSAAKRLPNYCQNQEELMPYIIHHIQLCLAKFAAKLAAKSAN